MLTFGSDPEFVLLNSNDVVSAIDVVKGNRDERIEKSGHAFFYDNVLAECNVRPGNSKEEVVANFKECLQLYSQLVKPYRIAPIAAYTFPKKHLQCKEAKEVNCSAEVCVYRLDKVDVPQNLLEQTDLRTAGGHVHIGHPAVQVDMFSRIFVIRMMDLFIGVPSVFLDKDKTSKTRKELYGQPGRWRPKTYGCEYRTPGNFWLSSPRLVELMYDISKFVVEFVSNERHFDYWSVDYDRLNADESWLDENFHPRQCHECFGYDLEKLLLGVQKSDKKSLAPFMEQIKELVPASLYSRIEEAAGYSEFDMYKEWNLT